MDITYNRIFEKNRITILIFILIFFLATVFFFFHWPTVKPVNLVTGNHYYLAQQMSMGHVLYRDLFSDKPPLNEYIAVLCFSVCRGELFPAIILTRFVFFFFFILSAIPLFIITKYIVDKSHLAWLVVLIYLSFDYPYARIALGSDWHTLMNFFALLSVLFFLKNRYVLSGLFSSLAVLSWQPGIIFFIATSSAVILFPNDKRGEKLSRVTLGFLSPILLLLLYTHISGYLSDLIKQTILFGKVTIRHGFLAGIGLIPKIVDKDYGRNIPIIILGVLGFIINFAQITINRHKKINLKASFLPLSVLSMTIIFSLIDFQGPTDFIPFVPWLAFYAVYSITFFPGSRKSLIVNIIPLCFILALIVYSLKGTIRRLPSFTLKKQKEFVLNNLKSFDLREDDLLLCMHSAQPLLFMNKKNMLKYIYYFNSKHYRFIEKYEENGFNSVLYSINERKPKLIYVPKVGSYIVNNRRPYRRLRKILDTTYEKFESEKVVIFIRK